MKLSLTLDLDGLRGIPATNWETIGNRVAARLAELVQKKNPTPAEGSEARKLLTMLHALDDAAATGNHAGAQLLLQLMPYTAMDDNGIRLAQSSLHGLSGPDKDGIQKGIAAAGGFIKKLFGKIKNRKNKDNKRPFIDKVKGFFKPGAAGGSFTDKAKEFFDKVKPTINVDAAGSFTKDWWKWLGGAAGIVLIGGATYKWAKK